MTTSVLRPGARVSILVALAVVVVVVGALVVHARGPAGMAGQIGDEGFARCLRSAGHDPAQAEDWTASSERRIGHDPATLTCVADDLPDTSRRASALAVAYPGNGSGEPTDRLTTLVGWYAFQPRDSFGSRATQRLGRLLAAMRANDPDPSASDRARVARDRARTEQVLAWQLLIHSQGQPANFDRWVRGHRATIGTTPYAEVPAYVAWLRAGAPNSARAVLWRSVVAAQGQIRRAVQNAG
jgi:hypothetical protein